MQTPPEQSNASEDSDSFRVGFGKAFGVKGDTPTDHQKPIFGPTKKPKRIALNNLSEVNFNAANSLFGPTKTREKIALIDIFTDSKSIKRIALNNVYTVYFNASDALKRGHISE